MVEPERPREVEILADAGALVGWVRLRKTETVCVVKKINCTGESL
ncbi:hypothetical protein SAMN05216419_101221 [Nitrosomonas cryotolerans]|uniref:Uncharacterized protein n=1 Tax=Nitrosomonas cryotolerans ATCC 49181 TaxID=1131553 RepID=A0A1N6JFK3_9PROT|nr:hypothetical protein [Nitrosomonas cryotolerans]SFP66957.1 hypothetical protein SAMN05216419_101221 [Nitrosomonas cryotolerans]SIO43065.1 hypothetical protein SAMN02743940_2573 [Nitrosomonas cryotolerans ATCC 49181]